MAKGFKTAEAFELRYLNDFYLYLTQWKGHVTSYWTSRSRLCKATFGSNLPFSRSSALIQSTEDRQTMIKSSSLCHQSRKSLILSKSSVMLILEVNLWISSFCFLGTILPAKNSFIYPSSQINLHTVEKSCFCRGTCTYTMLRSVWLNMPLSPFFLSCFKFNYCPLWWCLEKS